MSREIVLSAEHLRKTFRLGFRRRRVQAVRDVSLSVARGEIFGFLGPNGAGKTTTLKMLMGLIFPDGGTARVLGLPVGDVRAKARLGYLPESPYFYEYLTPEEFLDFAGRLCGLSGAECRRRRDALLSRVGLDHARGRPLRKFSKGMLQRAGIAQALMGDPELVILDEPMTGLDPIGRKEIRDLMLELRREGRTVFFSTHILHDVELTCDRVAIVIGGQLRAQGPLHELLSPRVLSTSVVVEADPASLPALPGGTVQVASGGQLELQVPGEADLSALLSALLQRGARVVAVQPRRESLEDLFVRQAQSPASPAAAPEASR